MIDSLLEIAAKDLDGWDRKFLHGIKAQLAERRFLSPKQRAKLDEICAEQFG